MFEWVALMWAGNVATKRYKAQHKNDPPVAPSHIGGLRLFIYGVSIFIGVYIITGGIKAERSSFVITGVVLAALPFFCYFRRRKKLQQAFDEYQNRKEEFEQMKKRIEEAG